MSVTPVNISVLNHVLQKYRFLTAHATSQKSCFIRFWFEFNSPVKVNNNEIICLNENMLTVLISEVNDIKEARFEVFTAALLKIKVFWDSMPCCLARTS
jgi:hypothetical protein